jgi:hypothetical protein
VLTARAALALVLAAVGCALGALILGEYDFSGVTPYFAGALFGLVIAELVVEVGKLRSWLVGLLTAVLVGGALLWAAWISSGEGLRPFPAAGWAAVAVGMTSSAWRAGGWRAQTD